MGVALLGVLPGAQPPGAVFLSNGHHVPDTVPQIGPLLDDGPPGRPDCRGKARAHPGEHIPEGRHVLPVEVLVAVPVHVLGPGGPLGVDVEHEEAVVPVAQGDPLDRFQRVVQLPRRGRGGVDADADEGILPPGPQQIPVVRIVVGDIEPGVPVKGLLLGGDQGFFKGQQPQLLGLAGRNVHKGRPLSLDGFSPGMVAFSRGFFYDSSVHPITNHRLCRGVPAPSAAG